MKKLNLLIILLTLFSINTSAQQTMGIFLNSPESFNGYTLFGPSQGKEQFLINNCGEKIHSWSSTFKSGSTYLLENGTLLKTGGGGVEMIDWDNTIIWQYTLPLSIGKAHHDIELLPNGNILMIAKHEISQAEVIQAGGSTDSLTIISDQIVEIQPDLINGGATIVWEWKAWDHLIQNTDTLKANYGNISESPEKIDINFSVLDFKDWLHVNAIDYNAQFDQIVLSVPKFNEFWIIDHSTTTMESADSTGGTFGKGGDLLYRWGNPQSYNQGDSSDQKLFFQHNPHWIEDSLSDGGKILLFNNQVGSAQNLDYSTVNIIDLPMDTNGFYTDTIGALGPSNFDWTYQAPTATDFYSGFISGAQRLPNGNTLICAGVSGRFFEIDTNETIVWEYVNPVTDLEFMTQGTTPENNQVFRCTRYAPDYAAFDGKTLSPQGYLEQGSTFNCTLYPLAINDIEKIQNETILYPNPTTGFIRLSIPDKQTTDLDVKIMNTNRQILLKEILPKGNTVLEIDVNKLNNGIYFVLLTSNSEVWTEKIIVFK